MAPPTEMRLTPSSASSPMEGAPGVTNTLTGRSTAASNWRSSAGSTTRGAKSTSAPGLLVGLEPGDGVAQVDPAVQVVLGPGRQHEGDRSRVGSLGGGPHPLGRFGERRRWARRRCG